MELLVLIRISIYYLLNVLQTLILVRVILSWFPMRENRLINLLYIVTEPILEPIRRLLHNYMRQSAIMIDLSPIIAFLLIRLVQSLVI